MVTFSILVKFLSDENLQCMCVCVHMHAIFNYKNVCINLYIHVTSMHAIIVVYTSIL